ncbi:MAG: 1,4-dihydroxy-2-naphthoate octaprenyltransferase [Desulfobacterales bacterium]|jgi:1,4-dihydroxy-2-naphthoate octaprenyltransferase
MNIYQNWFLASRPWSFTMSAISVSVGAALGAMDGDFSWSYYLITLIGMIILHAATNLMNDFYDVRGGVDYREASTAQYRPHPLLEGKLKPNQVLNGAFIMYGLSAIIGLYLAATRGWALLWLGLVGVFASFAYTAPPLKYKYKALGEFSVFLMWGPLMVEGAYFTQRQAFSITAFWVSLPFGVLVALVLLINNTRDMIHDRQKGIITLPILIGHRNGLRLYLCLVILAYLGILWMSIFGPLDPWSLIVFVSLPLAIRLLKQMWYEVPMDADARTAQLDTAFGVLLVISMIPGGLL